MKALLTIAFTVLFSGLQAQEPAFVVFYSKGKTLINNRTTAIKKGDKLLAADKISLSPGANLILICKNYETLRLTKPGKISTSSLLQQCKKDKPSFTASYFGYVWDELTHPRGTPEKDPTAYMQNVGAVSRGCHLVENKFPADTIIYASGRLPLHFITTIDEPVLTIFSAMENGEVMAQYPLVKNVVQFDSLQQWLKKPGTYYWQVTNASGEGCEPNVLIIQSTANRKRVINKLLASLPPAASEAEAAFMRGFILEENHYLAEAFAYYQQANGLAPANKYYQLAQSRFYE